MLEYGYLKASMLQKIENVSIKILPFYHFQITFYAINV